MRRFVCLSLVISSVLAGVLGTVAETRPQYGGTLHVALRMAPASLDPADGTQPDSFARRNMTLLIFETLVTADDSGRLSAGLATSWQASPGNQRWQFHLRRGLTFHDGAPLTPESAAASLRTANPSWNVIADADSIIIEREASDPDLPAELALARNAVVKRNPDGKLVGTGPFYIADWQPGRKLSLAAEENYWQGRPFLDAIEVEMGGNSHDQLIALEVGRANLVDVAPEQSHRVPGEGRRLASSAAIELVALQFAREAQSPEDKLLREALALSVERTSIRSVLLQGAGQPASSILPNWMSGYGFVFTTDADLPRARRLRQQVGNARPWTVSYDAGDSISRLLVERIALNAKDAGLTLQPATAGAADLRLVRIPLASVDAGIALAEVAAGNGLPKPKSNEGSVEELYSAEQVMLATQRMIPLFHLPVTYAAATSLRGWSVHSDGRWDLADAWLEREKP
jgi:peptide/nickel transport system substrate-binding protein